MQRRPIDATMRERERETTVDETAGGRERPKLTREILW